VRIGDTGTPGTASGDDDLYVEGDLEVDGASILDGAATVTGTLTANGTLDANGLFTLGDDGETGAIDTSDWDISATGDMSGIGSITANGQLALSTGTTNPITLTRSSSGQWLGMSDGTDSFGVYNHAGTPEGNVTANTGSLAVDTTNGNLYIKGDDGDATGWTQFSAGSSYSDWVARADSGSDETVIDGYILDIAGGTNGIDTTIAANQITLNLDTTEIGTSTFGSGSGFNWTMNSGATDPVLVFGSGTVALTGSFQATDFYAGDGTQGATSTVSGLTFKDGLYTSGSVTGFDNFQYIVVRDGDTTSEQIGSTETLQLAEGTGIDVNYTTTGANPVITITNSGDTTADTIADDGSITLTTETDGNYVASITNGSGISGGNGGSEGAALTLALGALTADWSQTGAFDIILANADSQLQILESVGGTYYATIDAGNLGGNESLTISGSLNIEADSAINQDVTSDAAVTFATLDTGQGANELYDMNQNVQTTDSPSFVGLTLSGDLAVNGDDITSDGALTLNATTYVRIGDTGTPGTASGDDDLYVEGDLEVDGAIDFTPVSTNDITFNVDTDSLFTLDSSVANADTLVISPNNTGAGTFTGTLTSASNCRHPGA
jgi:hypothetical protein